MKARALRTFVLDRLAEGWTPEQIAGWLKAGNERRLRAVGCETIYAFIYRAAQKAEQLWRYLTRHHKRRRPRRSRPSRDTIKNRVSIHERPENIDARTEAGHWEGDLILSALNSRFSIEDRSHEGNDFFAIFNGDPAGPGLGDPELRNRYGLNFRLRDPPFMIAEAQYRYNRDRFSTGLAGGFRVGAWHHFGRFDDQRFGIDGLSLADPSSVGIPKRLLGDSGIYTVLDQQLYRPPGGDAHSGITMFNRTAWAQPDRSTIDYYLDSGIVFNGLIRDDRRMPLGPPSSTPMSPIAGARATLTAISTLTFRSRCATTSCPLKSPMRPKSCQAGQSNRTCSSSSIPTKTAQARIIRSALRRSATRL